MDEKAIPLLQEILEELKKTNSYLNLITQDGDSSGLSDICTKLDDLDRSIRKL